MKRIIIILAFLVCGISSAQQFFFNGSVYVPKTTVQINAIVSPPEGWVEANSDTGSLWYFDGAIWKDTFVGVSSFADLEGDPYDNENLESALNAKANDSAVVKINPNSLVSPLTLAVSDSTTIASGIFTINDVVIDTTTRTPGGDNYLTGANLVGDTLTLTMNYGSPFQVSGFNSGNFVDLTTDQSIGGVKTFTSRVSQTGLGFSTFFGEDAGLNDNGLNRGGSGFGYLALSENTTGLYNSAFGNSSIRNNTTGSANSGFGTTSLSANTTGSSNSSFGNLALSANTTGSFNSAFGTSSGLFIADGTSPNETGSGSVFIGANTRALANGQSNQIVVGYEAIGGGSNTITLGNSSITTLRSQVTSITALSDARDKTGIDYIHNALGIVEDLNPVIFIWNQRDGGKVGKKATGFLAQELLETQNNSEIGEYLDLVDETNPDRLEARYGHLIPLMVKAIQELQARIIELENR